MSFELDAGIINRLNAVTENDDSVLEDPHTLQILSTKLIAQTTGSERYRIIISDGVYFLQAMLATQLNELVNSEQLAKNTVVVVERMTTNLVQNKRLLIILALRVLGVAPDRIGTPANIQTSQVDSPAPVAAPAPPVAPVVSAPKPKPQPQPQKIQPQQAKVAGSSGGTRSVMPIDALSPFQNSWTIKALVTQKSDIKHWSNPKGEGKLFSVTFMDESGEIRATAFNHAVDEHFSKFQDGKIYYISRAKVTLAKKKFTNVACDYELTLEKNTEIEECHENANVPMVKYHFVSLGDLQSQPKDGICDVIGILKEIGDVAQITTKANRQLTKRELVLVDQSKNSVRLTLWGERAEQFNPDDPNCVVAIKGAKVSDFGGRSLSLQHSSLLAINPDMTETFALRGWFDADGHTEQFQAQNRLNGSSSGGSFGFKRSELVSLKQMKETDLSENTINFSTRGTVIYIKNENFVYPACSSPNCSKKVVEVGSEWRCDKCEVSHPQPNYRYILSMAVSDWSGKAFISGFNEAGETVFGMTGNELKNLQETDVIGFNVACHKALCNVYNFSIRAKQETFNENTRPRYSISSITPLNYREEAYALLELIDSPWGREFQ